MSTEQLKNNLKYSLTSKELCDIITSSDRALSGRALSDIVILGGLNMLDSYFYHWNTAPLLYSQVAEKDRIEFEISELIVKFITKRLKLKKKTA